MDNSKVGTAGEQTRELEDRTEEVPEKERERMKEKLGTWKIMS